MNKIITEWLKTYWLHLVIWTSFIAYETIVVGLVFGVFGNPITYLTHYLIIMVFFYVLALRTLPWAIDDGAGVFWKLPLAIAFSISIFIALSFIADKCLIFTGMITHRPELDLNRDFTLRTLYRCIYFVGFATAYYFLRTSVRERRKTQELEELRLLAKIKEEQAARALAKAQNDFLKAQINPHFLFNTLDFVYHSINDYSTEAGDAIIALTEMMRYAIDSKEDGELILLGNEIEQVQKLVFLYQLRKNNELSIFTHFQKEVFGITFIPLVLLTLVENIFKHGSLSNYGAPTHINVVIISDTLTISTSNPISRHGQAFGTRNGLTNIEQRLRFAYGDLVQFDYGIIHESYFQVEIGIPLEKLDTRRIENL